MDEASQQGIIFIEGSGPTYATVDVIVALDISIVFISLQAHGNLTNCIYRLNTKQAICLPFCLSNCPVDNVDVPGVPCCSWSRNFLN